MSGSGSFLLIGKAGSGKTTTACTLEHPTLLIDVDKKARKMFNIQHLIQSKDVEIYTPSSALVEDRLRYRAANPDKGPKIEPQGYYEIVDLLNDIFDGNEKYLKFNTVVLDSITRVTEHLKSLLIYHKAQGKFVSKKKGEEDRTEGDMNWPSWGSYLKNLEELFNAGLKFNHNFICTAHIAEDWEHDLVSKSSFIKSYRPLIDGQMKDKLSGYFNEVYYMEVTIKSKEKPQYLMRTYGNKYDAHTSLSAPEFIEANLKLALEKYMPQQAQKVKGK